jgi:hypothetical protein
MESQQRVQEDLKDRTPRTRSHALVDIRPIWWNPFLTHSAVLLDVNAEGFKIEFVEPLHLDKTFRIGITIPLTPFGITNPRSLSAKGTLKWFDSKTRRAGGVFDELKPKQQAVLVQVINELLSMRGA